MMHVRSYFSCLRLVCFLLALVGFQVAQAADKIYATDLGNLWQIPNGNSVTINNLQTSQAGSQAYKINTNAPSGVTGGTAYGTGTVLINGASGINSTTGATIPIGNTGKTVPVVSTTNLSTVALAAAAARILGGPAGTVAAMAIPELVDWFNRNSITKNASTGSLEAPPVGGCGNGSYCICAGQNQTQALGYCRTSGALACTAVLESIGKVYSRDMNGNCYAYVSGSSGSDTYTAYYWWQLKNNNPITPVPVSPTQVQDRLSAGTAAAPTPNVVPAILKSDPAAYLDNIPAPVLSGPSSVAGPTSVTSTPAQNGQPAQRTTNNTTYNVTYNANTLNFGQTDTKTTEKQNTDGTWTVIDQSTTTTQPSAVTPTDIKTDCEKFPYSIGCMTTNGNDGINPDPLRKNTIAWAMPTIGFQSDQTCPQPITFTVFAKPYNFSYQPLCDKLATVRALILLLAGVMCAWIVADSFKVT